MGGVGREGNGWFVRFVCYGVCMCEGVCVCVCVCVCEGG